MYLNISDKIIAKICAVHPRVELPTYNVYYIIHIGRYIIILYIYNIIYTYAM